AFDRTSILRALSDVEPRLSVLKIDSVAEQVDDVLAADHLVARLTEAFGLLSVFLACLGLFGVIAYMTSRRTKEIGIRLSLGATPGGVLDMVMRESMRLVVAGIALGLPLALVSGRVLDHRLYGISSTDGATLVVASLAMMLVGGGAVLVPARRASRL